MSTHNQTVAFSGGINSARICKQCLLNSLAYKRRNDVTGKPVYPLPKGLIGLLDAHKATVRALSGDSMAGDIPPEELTPETIRKEFIGNTPRAQAWENARTRLLDALRGGELQAIAVSKGEQWNLPHAFWDLWASEVHPFKTGRVDYYANNPPELRPVVGWIIALDAGAFKEWRIENTAPKPTVTHNDNLPANIQNRATSKMVKDWFENSYTPSVDHHDHKRIPSRDDDLRAAKAYFDAQGFSVSREDVRAARSNYANIYPVWKQGGNKNKKKLARTQN